MTLREPAALTRPDSAVTLRAHYVEEGLSRVRPDELVRAGVLRRAAPSVFVPAEASLKDRSFAALEHAGDGGVITGWAACAHHRMHYVVDKGPIPVLVTHDRRRVSTPSVTVVRTRRPPASVVTSGGLTIADPVRALVDMARAETILRTVRAVVLHAVWTRLVTEPELRDELNAGARNGSALARRVLDDAVRGAASAPEAEKCDALLAEAGPRVQLLLNPRIVVDGLLVGRTDGWLLGTGLGYESSSREQHGDEEDRAETDERSDRFSAKGLQLLHRSPARFRRDPAAWARTVLQAAAARKGREPSGLVVVPHGPVLPASPEEMFLYRTGALARDAAIPA